MSGLHVKFRKRNDRDNNVIDFANLRFLISKILVFLGRLEKNLATLIFGKLLEMFQKISGF